MDSLIGEPRKLPDPYLSYAEGSNSLITACAVYQKLLPRHVPLGIMAWYWTTGLLGRLREHDPDLNNVSKLSDCLSSDILYVKHEDEVANCVELICRAWPTGDARRVRLWRCVRIRFCSPELIANIRDCVQGNIMSSNSITTFPAELQMLLLDELLAKATGAADIVARKWGALMAVTSDTSACNPRQSYVFTLDVNGRSHLGTGLGIFFIWVNKVNPLANNDVAAELPSEYRENIAAWSSFYGAQATILNGAQCHAAVLEASCHPEFGTIMSATHDSGCLKLADVYSACAREGMWIKCVDIARFACLWLAGRGSTYLDTDMKTGIQQMPSILWYTAGRPGGLTPRELTHACNESLLVLPQDAEGLIQNNFIAVSSLCHPMVTLLLQACQTCALSERDVVSGTGPALVSAVVSAFKHSRVPPQPTLTSLGMRSVCGSEEMLSEPQVNTTHISAIRAALPQPLTDDMFGYLCKVEANVQNLAAAPDVCPQTTLAGLVHVLPPSAFFPRHWRRLFEPPPVTEGWADIVTSDCPTPVAVGSKCTVDLSVVDPSSGLFGSHGWDCTWASSTTGGPHAYALQGYPKGAAYVTPYQPAHHWPLAVASLESSDLVPEKKAPASDSQRVFVTPFLSYTVKAVQYVDSDPRVDPLRVASAKEESLVEVYDPFGVIELTIRLLHRFACFTFST